MSTENRQKDFKEWVKSEEPFMVAEGYVYELERRGYLNSQVFVPEVVVDHPEIVRQLHEEFVNAGSDLVLALTYNTHRRRLDLVGKKDKVEEINRKALAIAKEVAEKTGKFFASSLSHGMIFKVDKETEDELRLMYEEQVRWAKESGVDFIVAETLASVLEAKVAIECAKERGLPIVVTFNLYRPSCKTHEGYHVIDACKMAEDLGADVVGLNCGHGPDMFIPLLKELRQKCKGPLAALPIGFHTTEEEGNWFQLKDPKTGEQLYHKDIYMKSSCPSEIERFGKACQEIGVRYVGICCGNCSTFMRALVQTFGRKPPANRYWTNFETPMEIRWLKE